MSPAQFKLPLLSRQPILQNGSKTNSYLLRDDFICVMVPLNILGREREVTGTDIGPSIIPLNLENFENQPWNRSWLLCFGAQCDRDDTIFEAFPPRGVQVSKAPSDGS